MVGKIWDGLRYRSPLPYHGIVWDIELRSHIIADIVRALNEMNVP